MLIDKIYKKCRTLNMNGSIRLSRRVDKDMSVDTAGGKMLRVGRPRNGGDLAGVVLPQVLGDVHVLGAGLVALDALGVVGDGEEGTVGRKAHGRDEVALRQRHDLNQRRVVHVVQRVHVAFVVASANRYCVCRRRDRH